MRHLALLPLAVVALLAGVAYADALSLQFDTPKDWTEQPTKGGTFSPKKQWELPKAEGDSEAPLIKVYSFGGQGGSLDDNVQRWASQFKTKDGAAFPVDKAKKESFESNGLKITVVEIAGTYTPPAMMGGGDPKPGQKLLGAYVDGDGGPWFVKLQGPEKSVDKNHDAYVKWLKSAKVVNAKK